MGFLDNLMKKEKKEWYFCKYHWGYIKVRKHRHTGMIKCYRCGKESLPITSPDRIIHRAEYSAKVQRLAARHHLSQLETAKRIEDGTL